MKKRLVLKESVKSFLIVSSLFLVVIAGSIAIGKRNENIEQKKTDLHAQISQHN